MLAAMAGLVAVGMASVVAAYVFWGQQITVEGFTETIRSWGTWGIAASILLMVLHTFVPFPAELLACANGMIYGPYLGTLITWSGAMPGASLAFGLSRRFGRPLAERMIARRNWEHLDDWGEVHGWKPLLASRLVPVIAFNLVNFAAGLSRVSWWQFLWTTGIGILPVTVAMVVVGDRFHTFGWMSWLILLAALILFSLAARHLARRGGSG